MAGPCAMHGPYPTEIPPIMAVCLIFAQFLPSFGKRSNSPLTMAAGCGIFVEKLVRQCIKAPGRDARAHDAADCEGTRARLSKGARSGIQPTASGTAAARWTGAVKIGATALRWVFPVRRRRFVVLRSSCVL